MADGDFVASPFQPKAGSVMGEKALKMLCESSRWICVQQYGKEHRVLLAGSLRGGHSGIGSQKKAASIAGCWGRQKVRRAQQGLAENGVAMSVIGLCARFDMSPVWGEAMHTALSPQKPSPHRSSHWWPEVTKSGPCHENVSRSGQNRILTDAGSNRSLCPIIGVII